MFSLLLALIYVSFISLGLPDSLLGSAWPQMQESLGVSLSLGGVISFIITASTILSSLMSHRAIQRFGTGAVTMCSVAMTALALLGFSLSNSFFALCLWAIPYGLGAGSVDAALNNFVALHCKAKHMSWLHCFWGIGATGGPYIMGLCLSRGMGWQAGLPHHFLPANGIDPHPAPVPAFVEKTGTAPFRRRNCPSPNTPVGKTAETSRC